MCKGTCDTGILKNIFCNGKKSPAEYIYEWARALDEDVNKLTAECKKLENDVLTLTELVVGEPIDLEELLASKADAAHTHAIEDVNDLQSNLDQMVLNRIPKNIVCINLKDTRESEFGKITITSIGGEPISVPEAECIEFNNINVYPTYVDDTESIMQFVGMHFYQITKQNPGNTEYREGIIFGHLSFYRTVQISRGRLPEISDWEAGPFVSADIDEGDIGVVLSGDIDLALASVRQDLLDAVDKKEDKEFQTIVFTKSGSSYTDVYCNEARLEEYPEALYGVMDQIVDKQNEATKCKFVVEYNGQEKEVLGLLSYSWSDVIVDGHTMRTHTYSISVGSLLFTFEIVEEPQAGTFTAGEIHKEDLSSFL